MLDLTANPQGWGYDRTAIPELLTNLEFDVRGFAARLLLARQVDSPKHTKVAMVGLV